MNNIATPNTVAILQNVVIKRGHQIVPQAFSEIYPWLMAAYVNGDIKLADGWESGDIHLWVKTKHDIVIASGGDDIHFNEDGSLSVTVNHQPKKLTSLPDGYTLGKNAHVWQKNGDHPDDYKNDVDGLESGELRVFSGIHQKTQAWEGQVVRYFRDPEVSGDTVCGACGHIMHFHGWIDQGRHGITICPGDTVIAQDDGYAVVSGVCLVDDE